MRGDDADAAAVEGDVLMAFEQFDIRAAHVQRAVHVRERNGVRLARDFDEQAADHRQRERQLQLHARAEAGFVRDAHRAAHAFDDVVHRVEPDATARDLGDLIAQRKAGQQQEFEQLRFRTDARPFPRSPASCERSTRAVLRDRCPRRRRRR